MRKFTAVLIMVLMLGLLISTAAADSDPDLVDTLRERIAARNETIQELRSRLTNRNETIQTLRERLEKRNETIATLRANLDEQQKQAQENTETLRERLNQRNTTIEKLREEISGLRAQIGNSGNENEQEGFATYEVTFGDTLYKISRKFEVNMQEIISANDLNSPYILEVGQKLLIPSDENQPETYTVERGDSVFSVASKLDANWVEIINQNNLEFPYWLTVGQVLEIPK